MINQKHKKVIGNINLGTDEEVDEICDGELYWEEVNEGYMCTKCQFYTGSK